MTAPSMVVACLTIAFALSAIGRLTSLRGRRVSSSGRRSWLVAHGVVLAASAPLLWVAPAFLHANSILPGDASMFAGVASAIAEGRAPRGWVDTYAGGFPWAPQYQPLATMLEVALLGVGLAPVVATNLLGLLSYLALPQAFVLAARLARLRPLAAIAGGVALSLVSAGRPMFGGVDAVVAQGLEAQVVAMPLLVLAAGAVLGRRARWTLPVLGWLAVAAHPQLLGVALGLGGAAILVAGPWRHRRVVAAFTLFVVAVGVSAAALYARGLTSLHVPFGFPHLTDWRARGFNPVRIPEFVIEGALLDSGRDPILMSAWAAALGGLATGVAHRRGGGASRALIVAAVMTVLLPFAGQGLTLELPLVLRVLATTRVLTFAPIVCAGALALAVERLQVRLGNIAKMSVAVALAGLVSLTLPAAGRKLSARAALDLTTQADADHAIVEGWLGVLRGGRLYVDDRGFRVPRPAMWGAHLASSVPIAEHGGGPGTQVAVNVAAASALDVTAADGAARAEALGVRWVLHSGGRRPMPTDAWRLRAERGGIRLSDRVTGSDLWAVACVKETWSGRDASLRAAILEDLDHGGRASLDPRRVTVLDLGAGELRVRTEEGACDASLGTVLEIPTDAGDSIADVEVPPNAIVVLRVSAHEDMRVQIDDGPFVGIGAGTSAMVTRVAPGFLGVRVPAGRHRVHASFMPPPSYALFATLSFALALASTIALRRRDRAWR